MNKKIVKQLLEIYLEVKKAKLKEQSLYEFNKSMVLSARITKVEIEEIENQLKIVENQIKMEVAE